MDTSQGEHSRRVSVVIPAFNEERYVATAIRSAQAQTRKPYEILVIDDGSSDHTARVATDAGAVVIRQENTGVSAARNRGVAQARGEWIAFLDADDQWVPDKLERQFGALAAFPQADVFASDFSRERRDAVVNDAWTVTRAVYRDAVGAEITESAVFLKPDQLAASLLYENFFPTSSILAKRDVLLEAGGFDESLAYCEDHDYWLRVARTHGVAMVQAPLVRYRMHELSASSRWEKVLEGDVALSRRILELPRLYHANAVSRTTALLPKRLYRLGVHYARSGKPELAASPLMESLRLAPNPKALVWLGAAALLRLKPVRAALDVRNARRESGLNAKAT